MKYSEDTIALLKESQDLAIKLRHEYLQPEHLLRVALNHQEFQQALFDIDADNEMLAEELDDYLNSLEKVPQDIEFDLALSVQFSALLSLANDYFITAETKEIIPVHLMSALLNLED